MTNEEIVRSNKRWFVGLSLFIAVLGTVLLMIGLSHPPAIITAMLAFFTSGLFLGTFLVYRIHNVGK